jgi:hypothetical protein
LIDDGLVPPPHPARSKRLTILPTASFLTSTASLFMAIVIHPPSRDHAFESARFLPLVKKSEMDGKDDRVPI